MALVTHAVVLNYRTPEGTIRAVKALQACLPPPAAVIVVDNASGDDSLARFARELPGVVVEVAASNGGFSAGCNLGIRRALDDGAARVLLVNSDVVISSDAIAILEAALESDATLGIAGPMVLMADGTRVESIGIDYAPASGRMRHRGFGMQRSAVPRFARADVTGVSGCTMLVRREVFDRVGLLTEEFFFGFEDLDFCLRARGSGYRVACIGDATVRHDGHATIGRSSSRRIYFGTRNHLLLAQRTDQAVSGRRVTIGTAILRFARTTSIAGLNLAHVLATPDVDTFDGLRAWARGIRDYAKGRYGRGE